MSRPPGGRGVSRLALILMLASCGARSAAEEHPWHEPLLRAVSADYRTVLARRERLRAELATLPPTPRNQQSGRIGFQAYHYSRQPGTFSVWLEIELSEEAELDAVVLVPVEAPHREFPDRATDFRSASAWM